MRILRSLFFIISITIVILVILIFSLNQNGMAAGKKRISGIPGVHQQKNVLFLVTDRLDTSKPGLRSAWLLIQVSSNSNLTFLPIYPSLSEDEYPEIENLGTTFSINEDGSLSSEFVEILKTKDIQWDEYLLLDELALAGLVELLDGVWISNELVDSQAIALGTHFTNLDQNAVLINQAQMLSELCRSVPLMAIHPDFSLKVANLIIHSNSSMSLTEVKQAIAQVTEPESMFSCEFPSLNLDSFSVNSNLR